jgi:ubiquinone/menaquinone biosynthesis C-methylase UbiE
MAKWFPKLYDTFMGPLERGGFKKIRMPLIEKAQGQVLEIGSGTGINFPYYTKANQVIAIEPEPLMNEQSIKRAMKARVPIEVIQAGAEEIPFSEDSFDTVVSTLVFCTIPNPTKALQEIRRVCKANGTVLFFEHVRLKHSRLGKLQDLLTPVWKRLCDGCHLNRNTYEMINEAGFSIIQVKSYYKDIFLTIEAKNIKI